MKIVGHGIDLCELSRIEQMLSKHGNRFLNRVYTSGEQAYCSPEKLKIERLAARFAVKEAVMKTLGTGWTGGVAWTDIETRNAANGKPEVILSGKLAEIAAEMGIIQVSISITHAAGLAVASAIAVSE